MKDLPLRFQGGAVLLSSAVAMAADRCDRVERRLDQRLDRRGDRGDRRSDRWH